MSTTKKTLPLIHPQAEKILRQVILKDLENKGRKGYDKPHTEAVVYWMKHLITTLHTSIRQPADFSASIPLRPRALAQPIGDAMSEALREGGHLDSHVLITAAYAHDWGYSRIKGMSETKDFEAMIKFKALHMQFGGEMIEALLYSRLAKLYTEQQKLQVIELVRVHDKVRELKTEAEILLMEADTLGMLDTERAPKTLSPTDLKTFLETSIYNLRLPRFQHQEAKEIAEELLAQY